LLKGLLMKKTLWILVCDSAQGRLFEARGDNRPWELLQVLVHSESRSKADELVGDRMGTRSSQGPSVHHNALAPSSSPKEVEKEHFGHTLATMLDQALRSQKFDGLVLVSGPQFLGLLKGELGVELRKHLIASLDKDLTHMAASELEERLGDLVRAPVDERDDTKPATKHAH